MAPPTTLGDRFAKVIEYWSKPSGLGSSNPVALWIDAATHLPIKTLIGGIASESSGFVVQYREFKLHSKIDPNTFELPK